MCPGGKQVVIRNTVSATTYADNAKHKPNPVITFLLIDNSILTFPPENQVNKKCFMINPCESWLLSRYFSFPQRLSQYLTAQVQI